MKKLFNFGLLLAIILFWYLLMSNQNTINKQLNKHLDAALSYKEMGAYLDALDELNKSLKYARGGKVDDINTETFTILLLQDNFSKANSFIEDRILEGKDAKKYINLYLEKLLESEEYGRFNKFIEKYKDAYNLTSFTDKTRFKFVEYRINLDRIKQIFDEHFHVFYRGKDLLIDVNARTKFTSNYDEIVGLDEDNRLVTVKNQGENLLVDFQKNIRSKLVNGTISKFEETNYIQISDENILRDKLNHKLLSTRFIDKFRDGTFAIGDGQTIRLLDKTLKEVASFEASDLKTKSNKAKSYNKDIYILKNGAFKAFDIKKKIYSREFQDIDFSYCDFIAVKSNGKWAFMDDSFNLRTAFDYDYARSFKSGLGLVKIAGKFYLIDRNFKLSEALDFEDFIAFNDKGVGFGKKDGSWKMLRLIKFVEE